MPHKMMNPQIAYVLHDNRLSIEARMIGREDNGENFVITGVGAGHYVGTCKKEPSKNKSVSEKTCNARESSGRLDADRNVDRNDIAKDKEVK